MIIGQAERPLRWFKRQVRPTTKKHILPPFRPPPTPPRCPVGWQVGPPDFVIVGADQAGARRWLRLMADHPAVQVTEGAHGIHFWEHIADRWLTQDDITSYHQFFPRPPGGITGESTPQYMSLWWVPRMLADAAPDARIIVLVRDPVDRYVLGRSQLEDYRALNTARGMSDRSFTRRAAELSMHRGQYALQLAWLMQSYPRERILVLQHEQCVESVEPMLARTFDFLGIDATSPASRSHTSDADPAPTDVVVVEPERLDLLRRLYRPEVLRLKELVPELDLSLWPNFADLGD